jgi:hypothetical protein
MRKKPFALGRQFDASRRAMKDRDSDLLLKLFDLHAHGRLRTVQLLRRHSKAAVFGDRNEHMKKLEIDLEIDLGHVADLNFEKQINP